MSIKRLFNEIGLSLVIGSGNWIGVSYEIEEGENEVRRFWLSFPDAREFKGAYIRIWIGKTVYIYSSHQWKKTKKGKWGFKCIFGMQYELSS